MKLYLPDKSLVRWSYSSQGNAIQSIEDFSYVRFWPKGELLMLGFTKVFREC
jgi:hypothetical protein